MGQPVILNQQQLIKSILAIVVIMKKLDSRKMGIKLSTKWDQRELDKKTQDNVAKFLVAAGEAGQNAFIQKSPIISGLLKNSLSYSISSGGGNSSNNGVSRPSKNDTVRIGSGIIYAEKVESRGKSAGWMSSVWDFLVSGKVFEKLAGKIFKI